MYYNTKTTPKILRNFSEKFLPVSDVRRGGCRGRTGLGPDAGAGAGTGVGPAMMTMRYTRKFSGKFSPKFPEISPKNL